MNKRNKDVIAIQQGACNPSGVARALVRAIDEAREEKLVPRNDPACRLICHQLAFLMGVGHIDNGMDDYGALIRACEEK